MESESGLAEGRRMMNREKKKMQNALVDLMDKL
jgi:hypothetical protein